VEGALGFVTILTPLRGWAGFAFFTPGLRPGLHSCAAPRLDDKPEARSQKLEARTQRPRNKLVPAFSLRTYNPHNM